MRRMLLVFTALILLTTGCASMRAYQVEQAKWQGLADQATAALGSSQVTVLLKGNTRTGQYIRLSRTVELGIASDEDGKTWLLAHELGHHIRGHINVGLEQEMEATLWRYEFFKCGVEARKRPSGLSETVCSEFRWSAAR